MRRDAAVLVAGIDLGHERTRVVVLDTSHEPPTLVGSADEATPAGFFFSGRLQRVVEAGAWVRRVLAMAGAPRPDRVVFAVAAADAQVRRVAVPSGESHPAILRSLRTHAQFRSGGDPAGEWHFDFQMLKAAAGQVLGVAGSVDGIGAVQAVARAAGFPRPVISTVEVALANAYRCSGEAPAPRCLLLEGGHGSATIALLEEGVPVAFRRVLLAGKDLDRDGGGRGDVSTEAAQEWAARVAHEMRMLVGAVVRDGSVAPPVWICGGLAASPALRGALSQTRGGVPVSVLDRIGGVGTPEDSAALAIAFGLAAGGLERDQSPDSQPEDLDGAILVDLFREGAGGAQAATLGGRRDVAAALLRDAKVRVAAFAVVVLLLAGGAAELWLANRGASARAELGKARGDSVAVAADLVRLRALEAERGRMGAGAEAVLALDRARDGWPRLMDRVAVTLPPYVWLSGRQEMESVDPVTGGFGFVLRGLAGSTPQVVRFERALRGGVVADAGLTTTERVDIAGVEAIRWEIRGRAGGAPSAAAFAVPLAADPGYRRSDGSDSSGQSVPSMPGMR
jgi:hypothetical protein